MKKLIFLTLFFMGLGLYSASAQWDPFGQQTSYARSNGTQHFGDRILGIIRASDAYWATHNRFQRSNGLKPYERWKYMWEDYGLMNVNPAISWMEAVRNEHRPATDDSNWQLSGTTPYTTTGDEGKGRVNLVVIDDQNPQIRYVGTPAGGLWKSTDGGQTWTPLTDSLPSLGVSAMAIDPNNHNILYIGTGDDDARVTPSFGIFKSTDGGQTWTQLISTGSVSFDFVSQILINPANSNQILFSSNDGIFKSTDGGQTWNHTLANENIREMRMKPGNFNYIYAVTNTRFFRSTDGGTTFSQVTSGLPSSSYVSRYVLDVTPAASSKVYVYGLGKGLYVSQNNGQTFSAVNTHITDLDGRQGWYDLAITVSDTDPDIIFLGEVNLWKSTDGGTHFSKWNDWNVMDDRYTHADIHFLEYYGNKLTVGSDGGAYVSTDNGSHFNNMNDGLAISQFYRISVSKTSTTENIYGGLQDNGGIAKQPDAHWNIYHGADGMDNAIDRTDPRKAYSFIYYGYYLNQTDNGGLTTTGGYNGPDQGNWVTPLSMSADNILYAGYSSLYKFENGNWTAVSNSFGANIDMLECHPTDPQIIYVGVNTTLYRSTDAGTSFSQLHNFNDNVRAVTVDPQSGKMWVAAGSHVYSSTDGVNWTDVSAGLPSGVRINDLQFHYFSNNETVYLANDIGVYRKTSGNNWETFNRNLPHTVCMDLELVNEEGKLWVATHGRSVWVTDVAVYHPSDDLKLEAQFLNGTQCDAVSDIAFDAVNNGQNDIHSFTYSWDINGETGSTTWNGNLSPGDRVSLNIHLNNAAVLGQVSGQIQATLNNDQNTSNNSLHVEMIVNKSENPNFAYDFESASNELLTTTVPGNDLWERAVPAGSVLGSAASGTHAYCTDANGHYPDQTTADLYLPCLDFSHVASASLSFDMAFDIETDWDALTVQYSTDGYAWTTLGTDQDPNWYNSSTVQGVCQGAQWTGTNTNISHYSHSLDLLAGEPHVYLRFRFQSDASVNKEGVMLDNLQISATMGVDSRERNRMLQIYPNPASDRIRISTGQLVFDRYRLMDLSGKTLMQGRTDTPVRQLTLRIDRLPAGTYILEVRSQNGLLHKRFIKD